MDTYNTDNPAALDTADTDLSAQELDAVAGGVIQPWPAPKPAASPGPTPFGGLQPWPVPVPHPTDPPEYGGDPRDPDPNYKPPSVP